MESEDILIKMIQEIDYNDNLNKIYPNLFSNINYRIYPHGLLPTTRLLSLDI